MRDYRYALEIMRSALENKSICPELQFAFKASVEALEKQLNNGWIRVSEKRPKSGETVLTYFYDEAFEIDQIHILTYYEKGDVLRCEDVEDGNFVHVLLGEFDRSAPEEGFYIYDSVDGNLCKWRKHADVITHWKPLLSPYHKTRMEDI